MLKFYYNFFIDNFTCPECSYFRILFCFSALTFALSLISVLALYAILKFFLLIMQIFFSCFFFNTIVSIINFFPGLKKFIEFETIKSVLIIDFNFKGIELKDYDIILNFLENESNNDTNNIGNTLIKRNSFNEYNFNNLIDFFYDFINVYIWFFFPFLIVIILLYSIHGLLGLYSAYIDYFQKNMDHVNSYRAFIPILFIFLLIIFIFFSLIFFFYIFKLIYILWFLFI